MTMLGISPRSGRLGQPAFYAVMRVFLLKWTVSPAVVVAAALLLAPTSFAQEKLADAAPLNVAEDEAIDLPLSELWLDETPFDSVRVIDGASRIRRATLEKGSLQIIPAEDSSGTFRLRLFRSAGGTVQFVDRDGTISPRTDLRLGMLQNCETHEGGAGIVRIYTPAREVIAELRADESGRLPATQLPLGQKEYVVQAVLARDGEPAGFVRRMNLTLPRSGEDIAIESIRLVPFDGLPEVDMAPSEFREHVLRVTRGSIKRWDLDEMNGVFIAASTARGRFTQREMQQMRELFATEDAVPAFTRGRIIPVHDEGSLAAKPYHYADGRFDPAPGWIVVAPDSTSSVSSWSDATERNGSGVYDRGVIVVNPPRAARLGDASRLVTYEAGRVLGMVANSNPLFFEHTMMVAGAGPQVSDRPTAVDRKTGAILYEESFPVGLDLDLVLGLEFDATAADQTMNGE